MAGVNTLTELFEKLEEFGITYERLSAALDGRDNWGDMVHSFEYLTVLGTVESAWRLREKGDRER